MADSYNNWSNFDDDAHHAQDYADEGEEDGLEDHFVEEHKPWPSQSLFELRQQQRDKDEVLLIALDLDRKLNHQIDISNELYTLERNFDNLVNAGVDFTDKERFLLASLRDRFDELVENGYFA